MVDLKPLKMHKIRVILDTEEDVIRTLLVSEKINLETLHHTIAKSFGFDGTEMASFYKSDNEWNQGQEIPLFNMSETNEGISMSTVFLSDALEKENDKLIYVYDFFNMWTFYVEVLETSVNTNADELPKTILSIGNVPKEAPKKEFTSEKLSNDFSDDFNDEFERLDDFDFDEY